MISTPTVLILGAGSSRHCNYPLGRELVAELVRLRGTGVIDRLPQGWDRASAEAFLTKLSYSDPSSIDAFLESNPTNAALGKYLIARQLKTREILADLFPPQDAGWYRYLFDRLLVDGKPRFEQSTLSVVTFNYDRSLEAYFYTRLQSGFGLSVLEALTTLAALPIIHVHGTLGAFPDHPYRVPEKDDPTELVQISKGIQIIHEIKDQDGEFCNQLFEKAHERLVAAERIFFLGFGFHRDNLRRFNFFSPDRTKGRTIHATVAGFGRVQLEGLRTFLGEFGLEQANFHGHECNTFFQHAAAL